MRDNKFSCDYGFSLGVALDKWAIVDVENLSRVRDLAFRSEEDGDRFGYGRLSSVDRQLYNLLDTLKGVENAFSVVRYYGKRTGPEPGLTPQTYLVNEPIDIAETIQSFEKEKAPRKVLLSGPAANLSNIEARKEALERTWMIPTVEQVVVLESEWKETPDAAVSR